MIVLLHRRFFYLYLFAKGICFRQTKLSESFKLLKYKNVNRLSDQRKQVMVSDGQTMKSSCFYKLVSNIKLKKKMKDSAEKA